MATRSFDLNIEEVLENWEVEHAIREVISNALDEQLISQTTEISITKDDQGDWHIRDCGITFYMIATQKTELVNFGTKGQVVIPRRLRREFEIEEGTKATVHATPEGILLKPITRAYIRSLRGSLKGTGVMKAMMEDRKREREL